MSQLCLVEFTCLETATVFDNKLMHQFTNLAGFTSFAYRCSMTDLPSKTDNHSPQLLYVILNRIWPFCPIFRTLVICE